MKSAIRILLAALLLAVLTVPAAYADDTKIWGNSEGDMQRATYDPTGVGADAFSMDNMVEGSTTKILTDIERTAIAAGIQEGTTPTLTGIQLTPQTAPAHSEGLIYFDSDTKSLVVYNEEADVLQAIGQEGFIRVYNDTGVDIADGSVCYLSGVNVSAFTVGLANADSAATSLGTIGFSTHLIEDGTYGYITRWGLIHNLNTIGLTSPNILYLSTTDGEYTETAPDSPNYLIRLGQVGVVDASDGTIEINVSIGTNTQGVIKIFNGAVLEDSTVTVASDGADITLSYEKTGGGDLSLFFDGVFSAFTAAPATIILTAGSDASPTLNYVYIPESTMVLTKSTTGFPATQHSPVATVLCQSAASADTDGVLKVHAHTDHLSDPEDQGHLSHINHWIRNQSATWDSGAAPTTTIVTQGVGVDNVFVAVTSGTVLQLHDHPWPAINMQTGGQIYAVNDDTTAYRRVTDLATLDEDSTGASLRSNNTYYSVVVWGVASEEGTDSKLYCNLPGGFYGNSTDATTDPLNYSNFIIPSAFRGTGFLIARVVLRYQTADSGTFSEVETEDLRGLVPSTAPGGGAVAAGTEFSDNLFRIQAVGDVTKEIGFDASGIGTGTTRTITMPDADVDLGDIATNSAKVGVTTEISSLVEDETPQLFADLDAQGNYIIADQGRTDDQAAGPAYFFDGVDDKITALTDVSLNPGSGDWSEVGLIRNTGNAGVGNYISAKFSAGEIDDGVRFNIAGSGFLSVWWEADDTVVQSIANTTNIAVDSKWHTVAFTVDRSSATGLKLWVDGHQEGYSTQDDLTTASGDMQSTANAYIGIDQDGSSSPFHGSITIYRKFNLALDPTDPTDKSIINGGPVPFKYLGASQTALVTGDDSDFDSDTGNWLDFSGATFDGVVGDWSGGGGTGIGKITLAVGGARNGVYLNTKTTPGKKYIATIEAKLLTGASVLMAIGDVNDGTTGYANFTPTGSETTFTVEFTASNTSLIVGIHENDPDSNGQVILIDNVTLTQIGQVAAYEKSGVGHNQWLDNSGNELHGTVSGAIPTNLPTNHREKYIDLTVTGDTSFTLPEGYLITAIVLTSDGAIGGGIDIGTTNGGGEIVTAQVIAGAGTVLCTLVDGSAYNTTGADDTIYITDADETGWDGATVIVRVQMERVAI